MYCTVKLVSVATSIKQATFIKQACIHFPKKAKALKCTCLKQEQFDTFRRLLNSGWTVDIWETNMFFAIFAQKANFFLLFVRQKDEM